MNNDEKEKLVLLMLLWAPRL